MIRYFAYGSNMDKERIFQRVDGFDDRSRALLRGYRLVFNKKGGAAEGSGYANIVKSPDSIVEGILYKLRDEALDRLDRYEGVPDHYRRAAVEVETGDRIVSACTYIAAANKTDDSLKPEKRYLVYLLNGSDILSEGYRNMLRQIVTVD